MSDVCSHVLFKGSWLQQEKEILARTLAEVEVRLVLPGMWPELGHAWVCICDQEEGHRFYIAGRIYLKNVLVANTVTELCDHLHALCTSN